MQLFSEEWISPWTHSHVGFVFKISEPLHRSYSLLEKVSK